MERWLLDDETVPKVFDLIPSRYRSEKKLRTSHTGNAHAHMNVSRLLNNDQQKLKRMRRKLIDISKEIARRKTV